MNKWLKFLGKLYLLTRNLIVLCIILRHGSLLLEKDYILLIKEMFFKPIGL